MVIFVSRSYYETCCGGPFGLILYYNFIKTEVYLLAGHAVDEPYSQAAIKLYPAPTVKIFFSVDSTPSWDL